MIVPMKRLTLIGLSCEKESTLKALQRLGAVQLISEGELTDSENNSNMKCVGAPSCSR